MLFKITIYTYILYCLSGVFLFTSVSALPTTATTAPENTSKLSLATVVKKTLQQNPEVLKNRAYRLAADAAIRQAKSGFLPKVSGSLGVGRSNTTTTYSTSTSENSLSPIMTNFSITQPVFSGFGTYNLVQQRKEEFKGASFNESYTKEDLALQATSAYLNVLLNKHLHELTKNNVGVHKEILTKVDIKYKGGGGTKADVDLAAGRLAEKMARLHNIEGAEANSIANFIKVVGIEPQNLFLPKEVPTLPKNLPLALNMTLEKNPAYFAAYANFKSATKALDVSKSTLLPTVDFEATQADSKNYSGYESRNKDRRGMLVARYNLFNGASDISDIDKSAQYRQAAMYDFYNTKNKVIESTTKAWNKFQADQASLTEHYKHLYAAEQALDGYKQQFDLGKTSLLNVLDMEDEVYNAKIDVINGQYAVIIDHYILLANIGMLAAYFTHKDKDNG